MRSAGFNDRHGYIGNAEVPKYYKSKKCGLSLLEVTLFGWKGWHEYRQNELWQTNILGYWNM